VHDGVESPLLLDQLDTVTDTLTAPRNGGLPSMQKPPAMGGANDPDEDRKLDDL
jgi:hypothetical protein